MDEAWTTEDVQWWLRELVQDDVADTMMRIDAGPSGSCETTVLDALALRAMVSAMLEIDPVRLMVLMHDFGIMDGGSFADIGRRHDVRKNEMDTIRAQGRKLYEDLRRLQVRHGDAEPRMDGNLRECRSWRHAVSEVPRTGRKPEGYRHKGSDAMDAAWSREAANPEMSLTAIARELVAEGHIPNVRSLREYVKRAREERLGISASDTTWNSTPLREHPGCKVTSVMGMTVGALLAGASR